jgi:hypothetical protein
MSADVAALLTPKLEGRRALVSAHYRPRRAPEMLLGPDIPHVLDRSPLATL